MKRTLWNLADIAWFLSFEVLLAFALGIPIIGIAFMPLALLFLKAFCKTVPIFSSSWIIWSIPYTFVSVFFLSFFAGGNSLTFTFKTFWLSLSKWFSAPISHFAMASVFFLITYIVAYFIAHLLKGTLNTYIALAVSSIIVGISTQYCCPIVSFGFTVLFMTSFLLSLSERKKFEKRTLIVFLVLLIFGALFFSVGTLHRPFTPLEKLFSFHSTTVTQQSTSLVKKHQLSPIETGTNWKKKLRTSEKVYIPTGNLENIIFQVIIYLIGGAILLFGVLYIVAFFKFREKTEKKKHTKNFLTAMWILGSAAFILFMLMYMFNIFGSHELRKGRMIHFNPNFLSPYSAPQNFGNLTGIFNMENGTANTFFGIFVWTVIAIFGLATVIYMISKFLKSMTPAAREGKKSEEDELDKEFPEDIEEPPSSASPAKRILFCYNLLRRKIGNPSSTPYEFEREVRKKFEVEGIDRVTELFVKLRYAHENVCDEDAKFVCQWVKEMVRRF